jgi:hypothetical protein
MSEYAISRVVASVLCAAAVLMPVRGWAGEGSQGDLTVGLRSGAWELGVNASVVSRAGAGNATLAVFSNRFWMRRGLPLSAGAVLAYSHVSDLDRVDVEALFAVYKRLTGSSAYGYFGVGGGLRQEWVGSFSQVRYPLGVDIGLKALVSWRAAVTVVYQFRRFLNDPVADFNEHRFVAGISIFFRNGRE